MHVINEKLTLKELRLYNRKITLQTCHEQLYPTVVKFLRVNNFVYPISSQQLSDFIKL